MIAAIYVRTGKDDGDRCDWQSEQCRDYASRVGWTIHEEYIDKGVSGLDGSRPALDKLLHDAQDRRFGAVIVEDQNRLGCNFQGLDRILKTLDGLGVSVFFIR